MAVFDEEAFVNSVLAEPEPQAVDTGFDEESFVESVINPPSPAVPEAQPVIEPLDFDEDAFLESVINPPREGPDPVEAFAKERGFGEAPDKFSPVARLPGQLPAESTLQAEARRQAEPEKPGLLRRVGRAVVGAAGRAVETEKRIRMLGPMGEAVKGIAAGTQRVAGAVGDVIAWLAESGGMPGVSPEPVRRLSRAVTKKLGVQKPVVDFGKFMSDFWDDQASKGIEAPADGLSWAKTPVSMAARTVGETAPMFGAAIAATIATKSPVPAALMYGLTGGAKTYDSARESGATINKSDLLGTLSGIWEGVSELAFNKVLLGGAGKRIITRMLKGGVTESVQELIQTMGTNLIEKHGFDKERAILTMDQFLSATVAAFALGLGGGAAVRADAPPPIPETAPAVQPTDGPPPIPMPEAVRPPPIPTDGVRDAIQERPTIEQAQAAVDRAGTMAEKQAALDEWKTQNPEAVRESEGTQGKGKSIRVGNGMSGGEVVTRSAREPGKIQVTSFMEDGTPRGHENYPSFESALASEQRWTKLDHPVSKLADNAGRKIVSAWEEATFEHPYKDELMAMPYAYVSPLRPMSGISIDGRTSADKSGRVGVLYRDAPVPIDKLESLSLVPATKSAIEAFAKDYVASKGIVPVSTSPLTLRPDGTLAGAEEVRREGPPQEEVGEPIQPQKQGPGAASIEEFQPVREFTTSNKNAQVDQDRAGRGLPPMMTAERQSNAKVWDEAMREIDENFQRADEVIADIGNNPRAATPVENAILLHRRIDLQNEYEKALTNWKDATDRGDATDAARWDASVERWGSALNDLDVVTKVAGTQAGRDLQNRQIMAEEDFSLAKMQIEARQAKGEPLTTDERVKLIEANQKIAALQRQLQERLAGSEARALDTAMRDVRTIQKRVPGDPATSRTRILSSIRNKVEKGQQEEITPLVQQLARQLWEGGVREREPMVDALHNELRAIVPEITREDVQRAFSGYGNFKPLSKEDIDVGLRDIKGQIQQILKITALEARQPLEKTGVERRTPSDTERRLIQQVNDLKRKYGVTVTDPETQLRSALQARKTYYTHRIADLKHEIETGTRIVKDKAAPISDTELELLKIELADIQKDHDSIFGPRELSDEQRLNMAISAAERNETQWTERLELAKQGVFGKRKAGQAVSSPELIAIRARTKSLRAQVETLKAMANPQLTPEQKSLEMAKNRMYHRQVELAQKLARKDFAVKKRIPQQLDQEGLALQAQLDIAKERYKEGLERDRYKKLSPFGKAQRVGADVYDVARNIMTTGELSFILRQGKFAALSHPIITAKTLPNMFRTLISNPTRARAIDLQTHRDPDADAARAAKLHLVEGEPSLSKQEEAMMGRWVGKIPVVGRFNRAAQVFLNRLRLDVWKTMRRTMSKTGVPTPQEDAQIASFVNQATGRGSLGFLEPAAVPLSRGFFSPRFVASRIQLLAGQSLWGGTGRTRRIIAREYARTLVGLGMYYTMLSLAFKRRKDEKGGVELDPRSSDFGKIRLGNTRLDPLAGLAQVITFAARTVRGSTKTLGGRVVPIRGEKVPFGGSKWSDVAARFVRTKLHPVPGAIANLFDGTDLVGNKITLKQQATNMSMPITYADIYQTLREQGLGRGLALSLLTFLGEGLQTYKSKTGNQPPRPRPGRPQRPKPGGKD